VKVRVAECRSLISKGFEYCQEFVDGVTLSTAIVEDGWRRACCHCCDAGKKEHKLAFVHDVNNAQRTVPVVVRN
jgi:hypothetical protein